MNIEIKEYSNRICIVSDLFISETWRKINLLFPTDCLWIVYKRLIWGNKYPFNNLLRIKSEIDKYSPNKTITKSIIELLEKKYFINQ